MIDQGDSNAAKERALVCEDYERRPRWGTGGGTVP
jgi:hypothetical protein